MRFQFLICFFIFFGISQNLSAQDNKLANRYYQSGEYEKAAEVYQRLFQATPNNDYYFNRYVESLIALENYSFAEKAIKEEIKKRPRDVQLYVSYGNLYEKKYEPEKAKNQYRKAIDNLSPNQGLVSRLGNAFTGLAKYDMAIEAFKKGEEILNKQGMFAYNLADLYRRKGDSKQMIHYYLNSVSMYPTRLNNLKTTFARYISNEDFVELQTQLYNRIQEEPDINAFPELLEWTFISRKQYKKALRQARSMDRRMEEDGSRVFNVGQIAQNDGDYDTAIEAFTYVIDNNKINSRYYLSAKRGLLNSKKKKITRNFNYSKEELLSLKTEYESFFAEIGKNTQTAYLMSEFANLQALYLNDLDSAISILNEMINFGGLNKSLRANAKLSLGDYYLMKEEIWEATLLYSQVDKEFKEAFLGEQARFKNAKLSYFNGDFEWAQEQFDILKSSTSKLISNDAIDMSVFIMDNIGLDTTDVPLKMYAKTDMLAFQNKYDEALIKLEEIIKLFPEHALQDDILYSEANIYKSRKQYDKAIEKYNEIIENHVEEIRCDNAIFELAQLYEFQLNQKDEAQTLYEKLFLDFSNSTFAIESRKRYRILRGDEI